MKSTKKVLLGSIATIALSAALIGGSTYALFTSQSSSQISVTSATVEITASATVKSAWSAKWSDEKSNYENEPVEGKFTNGGTYSLVDGTLTINNMTPGDGVTVTVSVTNNSTVKIQYAVTATVTGDLAKLITVSNTEWETLEVGENGTLDFNIAMGIDVSSTDNMGQSNMGKNGSVTITVKAVQYNANPDQVDWD